MSLFTTKPKVLRPYQAEDEKNIFAAWDEGYDIVAQMLTTGGGKTQLGSSIVKRLIASDKRVMWIAHREKLIRQPWKTMYDNQIMAGIIMNTQPMAYHLPAQVCSIQTITRRKELPHVDYIIIDEAHHVTKDGGYAEIMARYPKAKVLWLSATFYRLSREGFYDVMPGRKTKFLQGKTYAELVDLGWLVPYEAYTCFNPDMSDAKLSKGDWAEEDAKKAMEFAPIVPSYKEHCAGMQGITFAVNVAHSIQIARDYEYAGIPYAHIDADTSEDERIKILSDFSSGLIRGIANCGIYLEGADFPNCRYVQDAAPTKSLSKFLQKFGRATRAEDGLVDRFQTVIDRQLAISQSSKPYAIYLDNCGALGDHLLPDYPRPWDMFFTGTKGLKKQTSETMEITIFIAEDEAGNKKKTTNIREIEGMKLVKVTKEINRSIITLKSLKEFDKIYADCKNMTRINKPANIAMNNFIEYCKKNKILIVPAIWDYMEKKLITEISDKVNELARINNNHLTVQPEEMYKRTIANIEKFGVGKTTFVMAKNKYFLENEQEIKSHIVNGVN